MIYILTEDYSNVKAGTILEKLKTMNPYYTRHGLGRFTDGCRTLVMYNHRAIKIGKI